MSKLDPQRVVATKSTDDLKSILKKSDNKVRDIFDRRDCNRRPVEPEPEPEQRAG